MTHPLTEVLKKDPRYPVQAYEFVRDALNYAHEVMGWGAAQRREEDEEEGEREETDEPERHLTGQELCEAGRRLALEQYGMMAKVVLNTWGICSTGDIGEIVYNMIRVDLMRKSPTDQRADFDDVFDFQKAFRDEFDFAASVRPSGETGSK